MRTKQPKRLHQRFVDHYFDVYSGPTWHDGFKAALDMVSYELVCNHQSADSLRELIAAVQARIAEIEAEV